MKRLQKGAAPFSLLAAVYLASMLVPYLLWPGTGGYGSITAEKWRLFLLLTGGFAAAALLLRLELALVGAVRLAPLTELWRSTPLTHKFVVGYWVCSVISTLFSVDRGVAFWGGDRREGLLTITLYCVIFLLLARYARPDVRLLYAFAAAMALNASLALAQLASRNPLALYPDGMTYYDGNVLYAGEFLGTTGNVDILSAIACVAIAAFWIAAVTLRGKERYWLLLPLALCLAVLLRSRVAGGIIGVGVSALLTVPALAQKPASRRALAFGAAGVIVLCTVLAYLFGERLGGTPSELAALLHGRWDDRFGSGRLYIWRETLALVPVRLWFGGGPDTLGLRTTAAFERYDASLGVLIHSTVDHAHNDYLNILVNQGLLALLFYLASLLTAAADWIRRADKEPAAAICGGAALAYCVQAFFGVSSFLSTPYLWIALGLLCGVSPRTNQKSNIK